MTQLPERFEGLLRQNRIREAARLDAREPWEHLARGLAHALLGHDREARADFEAARSLGSRAEIELAFLDVRERRDVAGAGEVARRIVAQSDNPPEVLARAHHILGLVEGKLRRTQPATEALLEAERLYASVSDRRGVSQVRDTLGALMASLGRLDLAASHFMTSLVHKALVSDQAGMALTLGQMGRTHLRAGRYREAIECFELDLEISRELGDERGEVRMLEDIGRTHLDAGDTSRAITDLELAAQRAQSRGFTDLEFFARVDLGRALARAERLPEARAEVTRAKELCSTGAEPYHHALVESAQGEIAWHARDRSALTLLQKSAERFKELNVPDLEIPTLLLLAEALLHWNDRRNTRPAEQRILRALRFANEDGYSRFLPAVHQVLLRLELEIGARDESRPVDWSALGDKNVDAQGQVESGFVFLERLGEGTFGTTWRAYDTRRHAIVAVKRLKLEDLYDPSERQFVLMGARMELLAASQLRHPGVARVLEIGDDTRGGTYVVQEFVEGPTLREVIRNSPRPAVGVVLPVIADLARALDALHARKTIHRDLKPENVLLRKASPPGAPVLIDFGLAQRIDLVHELDGALVAGTVEYMSPEQARGEEVGPETDIHALGVIMYEWLGGVRPFRFQGDGPSTFRRVADAMDRSRPQALRELRADVPLEISTLAAKMLDRKAKVRPSSSQIAEQCDRWARAKA